MSAPALAVAKLLMDRNTNKRSGGRESTSIANFGVLPSLLVSYRPLAAWLIVEAKNTANSANSHRSAARIRRSTRSVLCATLMGICND